MRDVQALIQTFSILPEYLRTPEGDSVTNFRDWGPGLGRRFRSLKLWFVLRWYGVEGIQTRLRRHLALAASLESRVRANPRFEMASERLFNLVCFRLRGSDEENLGLLNRLNRSGRAFLTHTKLDGRVVLRLVVGQTDVEERHVCKIWEYIQSLADA